MPGINYTNLGYSLPESTRSRLQHRPPDGSTIDLSHSAVAVNAADLLKFCGSVVYVGVEVDDWYEIPEPQENDNTAIVAVNLINCQGNARLLETCVSVNIIDFS